MRPQMATANDFRRMALALTGAAEGEHMNHPDFRANGRIFATLQPDNARGMVKLTLEQQHRVVHEDPDTFEPASGAWGRQGCTMVRLAAVDEDTLGQALTEAWENSRKSLVARSKVTSRKSNITGRDSEITGRRSSKVTSRKS